MISCHGTPSCRLPGGWAAAAEAAGARFIQPDRPGYGHSDFNPDHSLLEWARDVAELADSLGLGRFAVVGTSGGGPVRRRLRLRPSGARVRARARVRLRPVLGRPRGRRLRHGRDRLVDPRARSISPAAIPEAAVAHAREECEQDAAMVARDPVEWLQFWFENEDTPDGRPGDRRPPRRARVVDREPRGVPPRRDRGLRPGRARPDRAARGGSAPRRSPSPRPSGTESATPWRRSAAPATSRPRFPGSRAHFFPEEGHSISFRHGEEILQALAGRRGRSRRAGGRGARRRHRRRRHRRAHGRAAPARPLPARARSGAARRRADPLAAARRPRSQRRRPHVPAAGLGRRAASSPSSASR